MKPVIKQRWIESERGWGQRPDGYSLHLTNQNRIDYQTDYWAAEALRNPSGIAPDIYERPAGPGEIVDVDDETFAEIEASKNGVRKG